jgi:hypothetical protein
MTTAALFAAAIAFVVAPTVWFMIRVNRADERKIERIREEWEAGGREKPWTWDVFRGGGGGT